VSLTSFAPRAGARRLVVAAASLVLFAASPRSLPAQSPNVRRLSLAEAIALAEGQNPALRAQAQGIESSRADEITAGLSPNPTFQNDTTGATAGIYQEIEVGGKRSARVESARLVTSIAASDLANARRSLILELRQAFVSGLLARAEIALAQANLEDFQKVLDLNRVRLEQGAMSGADFRKIELQRLQFQNDLADASLAARNAAATIRSLLAASDLPERLELDGELGAARFDVADLAELRRRAVISRPDLQSARLGLEKTAADVGLARANRWPDPTVGVSYLHTGSEIGGPAWFEPFFPKGEASNAMGLGVSFPIPLFNRNQGAIARAQSEQRRAEFLAEEARNQVLQDVETAHAALESSRDRLLLYETTYLSAARDSRDTAEFAFQRGATSLLDFLDAERTYRATRLGYLQQLAAWETNLAQLEAAVGEEVRP
jgi:outer membrane protein, heavy metal efflux system